MIWTKDTRMAFTRRLGASWRDLTIQLEIHDSEAEKFPKGEEPDRIWVWLEQRDRLEQLPGALTGIGRGDLAAGFERARPPAPRGSLPWRRSWSRIATGAAAVVLASAGVVAVLQPWDDDVSGGADAGGGTEVQGTPSAAGSVPGPDGDHRCGTDPTATEDLFPGIVEKTWDVNTETFVGVRSYGDPGPGRNDTEKGHYPECATVFIRCQRADGREIKDAPWRDRPLSTRRWYLLTTPKAQWLPAMYVRVIPPEGRSAADVPDCGEG